MPRRVTIYTNLRIFQYKILNNVLYLNEKLFKFKIVSSPLCSFCNSENETLIHLFYSCNLCSNQNNELKNTSSTKYATDCFLCVPDNKESFEIINHLHLILKYYLFKVKHRLEGLNKNIIKIYNAEKQICFNDSKKTKQSFLKNGIYQKTY